MSYLFYPSIYQFIIHLSIQSSIYSYRIYFTPNRALSGLTLVGVPGTSGKLNVVSESQILGQDIIMQLPFKLSQCPLGYYDPSGASTIEHVC